MVKALINQKKLGERLRARREALGLSQQDVADRMDVAPSTVQRAEAGTLNATVETLFAHCSALELPIATLVGGEEVVAVPTLNESIHLVSRFLRVVEKQPFLADLLTFSDEEFKKLKAAVGAIKDHSSTSFAPRKKLEK